MVRLNLLEGRYSICRLPVGSPVPERRAAGDLWSLTVTPEEISIVCLEGSEPDGGLIEIGWRALAVVGPLDFNQIGILAGISTVLAAEGISIFVLSTYETDYILIKEIQLPQAIQSLHKAGY